MVSYVIGQSCDRTGEHKRGLYIIIKVSVREKFIAGRQLGLCFRRLGLLCCNFLPFSPFPFSFTATFLFFNGPASCSSSLSLFSSTSWVPCFFFGPLITPLSDRSFLFFLTTSPIASRFSISALCCDNSLFEIRIQKHAPQTRASRRFGGRRLCISRMGLQWCDGSNQQVWHLIAGWSEYRSFGSSWPRKPLLTQFLV